MYINNITERQTFYMIDESEMPGKGGDCVTSLVHHYFSHFGAGEKNAEVIYCFIYTLEIKKNILSFFS